LLYAIDGINRTLELRELLTKCMNSTARVMQAEASSLMLLDPLTGELKVSIPTGPVKEEIIGLSIPKEMGIGGWVLKNKKPFLSNNVSETDEFWGDISENFVTKNIICVPLFKSNGEVIGVLQALNRLDGEDFTENDIKVFEVFAWHASSAIEKARQVDELTARLNEREMQFVEIHHRLKNNLAVLSALVELDMDKVENHTARQVLRTTETRIKSVSEAHALLYEQGEVDQIELSSYLKRIGRQIQKVFSDPEKQIHLIMDLNEVHADAKIAMNCGLVINEILINIYKHAFEGYTDGIISIALYRLKSGEAFISISDDGVGFDGSSKKQEKSSSNGMLILQSMVKKLKADFNIGRNPAGGTTFTLTFKTAR